MKVNDPLLNSIYFQILRFMQTRGDIGTYAAEISKHSTLKSTPDTIGLHLREMSKFGLIPKPNKDPLYNRTVYFYDFELLARTILKKLNMNTFESEVYFIGILINDYFRITHKENINDTNILTSLLCAASCFKYSDTLNARLPDKQLKTNRSEYASKLLQHILEKYPKQKIAHEVAILLPLLLKEGFMLENK